MSDVQTATDRPPLVYATEGTGPLLEREYSAVIEGLGCTPEAVAAEVRERFIKFAPSETACFRRAGDCAGALRVGDALEIKIALLGACAVRVVHVDDLSLTLRTVKGHPEAGRITFGAGRDDKGRTHFRIVSRTRASSLTNYLGYMFLGKQMQARCWIKFIDRLAADRGGRVAGRIHVRTRKVEEEAGDRSGCDGPTFLCSSSSGAG